MESPTSALRFIPFSLGQVVMTHGFADLCGSLEDASRIGIELVLMHASGDFGVLDDDDRLLNLQGLHSEPKDRVFSAYVFKDGVKVYVITEHDRSSTTVLLADEY